MGTLLQRATKSLVLRAGGIKKDELELRRILKDPVKTTANLKDSGAGRANACRKLVSELGANSRKH